jgi:cytosine/adenosine deaminase-related metal-dependent hydrolase
MIARARWVLPIDRAPIDGGWIEWRDDRIAGFGPGRPSGDAQDLGDVAILPGLVNAHTHLELSWMAGLVPPAPSMDQWIQTLLRVRREGPPGGESAALEAMVRAAVTMHATGTVLVGDISNTLLTPPVLDDVGLGGVVFHELLGFNAPDPAALVRDAQARVAQEIDKRRKRDQREQDHLHFSLVAHAPYSVSPALFGELAKAAGEAPLSVHLAESTEEIEFLRTGTGPMRSMLEALGVWTDAWTVPACGPVEYLSRVGYLRQGTLIVHGVHVTDDALEQLRRAGAVLVTCPRSNLWVGGGPPRLSHFYASDVPVAVGTDSLASVSSLNLFDELAEMRRLAPEVSAAALLDSATRQGADALGFGRDYGTLAPGKRAALVGVEVPASTRDVEEYLVSGVPASAVRRVA